MTRRYKKWSGWWELNSRPFDPQSNALTRLRYIPTCRSSSAVYQYSILLKKVKLNPVHFRKTLTEIMPVQFEMPFEKRKRTVRKHAGHISSEQETGCVWSDCHQKQIGIYLRPLCRASFSHLFSGVMLRTACDGPFFRSREYCNTFQRIWHLLSLCYITVVRKQMR